MKNFKNFALESEKMNLTKGGTMPGWLQTLWDLTPEGGDSHWGPMHVEDDHMWIVGVLHYPGYEH